MYLKFKSGIFQTTNVKIILGNTIVCRNCQQYIKYLKYDFHCIFVWQCEMCFVIFQTSQSHHVTPRIHFLSIKMCTERIEPLCIHSLFHKDVVVRTAVF